MAIPRIIHQTWKTRSVPAAFEAFQARWQALNPGYEYRLWTDQDNAAFVERDFPQYLALYRSFEREIYRADMVRCLYLARFGGVYVDLDVEPLRPLDEFLAQHGDCILGAEPAAHARKRRDKPIMACNAFLASTPGHPFWERMVEGIRLRALPGADPVNVTGPIALDAVYEEHGKSLGVTVSDPDAFFPLPDLAAQSLPLSKKERKHFQRMLELQLYPTGSFGVHHWAHTWIPHTGVDRLVQRGLSLGRDTLEVLGARKTIDEVARPTRYGRDFPELAFAPRSDRASRYRELLAQGSETASRFSVAFLVLLHDRLDLALLLRARLEALSRPFRQSCVLLLCDDSTDGSERVMEDWRRARPELVQNVPAPPLPSGLSAYGRMARLRNALLTAVEAGSPPDLIALLDGDLEGPVSLAGLLHSVALLAASDGPDGVAAFGVNNWGGVPRLMPFVGYSYYDPLAFREHTWERTESDAAIRRRLGRLQRGDAPLAVRSAFGGLALYRADRLRGLRYDEASQDCEHVSLHRALFERGGRLVVNPSLLLLAGRQGHHQSSKRS